MCYTKNLFISEVRINNSEFKMNFLLFMSIFALQCDQIWGKEKVELGLLYESHCPFSREFIVDQLFPTFNQVLKEGKEGVSNIQLGFLQKVVRQKDANVTSRSMQLEKVGCGLLREAYRGEG